MKKTQKVDYRTRDLLFVDLETTGLHVDEHEIIEIGALVVDPKSLKIKKEYHAKTKPTHIETATEEGLRIGQYSEANWKEAKEIKQALNEVAKLSPCAMVAGWKVDFDYHMLEVVFRKQSIDFPYDYHLFDVQTLAYKYFFDKKYPRTLSLRKVARRLGIEISEEHDAMTDIRATYEIFLKLMTEKI